MENELEHSRIEQRNRELHKVGSKGEEQLLHPLQKEHYEVSPEFGGAKITPLSAPPQPLPPKAPLPLSMKLLRAFAVIAITSAIGAICYFAFQFLDPSNRPSQENIVLALDMPVGANPGEAVDITVHVTNKNNVALDAADVLLQFPAGTYAVRNEGIVPIHEIKTSIGMITAGQTADYKVKAYILGEEQQLKEVKSSLSFRFINLNPTFTKTQVRSIRMLASPVTLSVDTLKRATSGQNITATVLVRSNTEVPLKDVLVSMEYPLGFVYQDAIPRPLVGNSLWNISDLSQSDAVSITINGVFTSEGAEERILRARIGAADAASPHEITAQYQEVLTTIGLETPFVATTMLFNDKTADRVVARYGVRMSANVTVRNTSDTPISHAVVEVSITGTGLDQSTIDVGKNGIYRAQTNSITWDERNDPRLARLEPGSFANLSFSFVPNAERQNGQYISNPQIMTSVRVRAVRENVANAANEVRSLSTSIVKVATQAEFATRALHYTGAFKNGGPMPPQVDKETQFTIVWSVRNASNALDGAVVTAILPPHAVWSGIIAPTTEDLHYDDITHVIRWKIGAVPAGAGVGSVSPREVSYQVILIPTKNQINSYPTLIEQQKLAATDTFTTQGVEIQAQDLRTTLPSDPQAPDRIGSVVP